MEDWIACYSFIEIVFYFGFMISSIILTHLEEIYFEAMLVAIIKCISVWKLFVFGFMY